MRRVVGAIAVAPMSVEEQKPPFVVRPRRADRSDLAWEDKADQLEFQALTTVRASAEKWGASLAAILGLFGTITLVKGRSDITQLTQGFQVAVAVLLLFAFLAAAVAVYQAAVAAQGSPRKVHWPGGGELRRWELKRAEEAKDQLKASRMLTFVAVVLVLAAIALTWFGKAKPTATGAAVIVSASGAAPRCGTLAAAPGGSLGLRGSDGNVVPFAPGANLVVVSGCPKP